MHALRIHNEQGFPVTVWLEPTGEDVTLLADESLTLSATNPAADFSLQLDWQAKDIIVWPDGDYRDILVHQHGDEIYCGHNRQHRTDRKF